MKVKKHNIDTLMSLWGSFATEYLESEDSIFEWQNSMDARRIIGEIIDDVSDAKKGKVKKDLKTYDLAVLDQTFEINECIWGAANELQNGYSRQQHWFYYRLNQKVFDSEAGQFTKR